MSDTCRLFLCARCRAQVLICSRCDRGQIYCGRLCSTQARVLAQRGAGRRYQASRRGRFAHAARARRYRARCKIVTHQGSADRGSGDVLPLPAISPATASVPTPICADPQAVRCHLCHARRAAAVRLGFVRRGRWADSPARAPDEHCS
jgi:hypothetical protein